MQQNKVKEKQEKLTFRVIQYCGKVLHKADHACLLVQCAHMFTTHCSNINNVDNVKGNVNENDNDTSISNKIKVSECV